MQQIKDPKQELQNKADKIRYLLDKKIQTESNIYEFSFQKDQLVASEDTDIVFHSLNKGQKQIIEGVHFYLVYTFCFSETFFVTGGHDRKLKIWQQDYKGEWKCIHVLIGHKDSVLCIALTKDEKQIISRSRDRTIKIWNFDGEKWSCIKTIPAVSGVVDSLSLNKENNELVFGCKQNLVIWRQDQLKWKKYSQINQAHSSNIQSVCHIPSKSQIISGANEIKIWNQYKEFYREISHIITSGKVGIIVFNEQLELLFAVANKKFVEIWKNDEDVWVKKQSIKASKMHDYYYQSDEDQYFSAMNVSKDGKYLALKDNHSDYVEIWKLK